ncbi:MAG: VWA domain-containing protein [Candidatus Omnitrophica bacterium]|nr:VWA domain-containing protein [Candidatus Omnitrophota bacterium]
MNTKRSLLYALAISLAAHLLFFVYTNFVKLPGIYATMTDSERMFNIKSLKKEIPQEKPPVKRGTSYVKTLKFENPVYSASISSPMEKGEKNPPPRMIPEETAVSRAVPAGEALDKFVNPEVKERGYSEEKERKTVDASARTPVEENLVTPDSIMGNPRPSRDFLDEMPGFTPKITGGFLDDVKHRIMSKFTKGYIPAVKKRTKLANLEEYLLCNLSTYRDPRDGEKYFRLSIRTGKDAEKLPVFPKEIIFMIDCSLSMERENLREFSKGLRYCLRDLGNEDYFNMMAFSEDKSWFRSRSATSGGTNANDALHFVGALTARGKTNMYEALQDVVKTRNTVTPSYIVLFTDGRLTRGVTDPVEIISRISDMNRGRKSIFTLGEGEELNRYLIDFISYKNRGWTEYAPHTELVEKQILRLYEKIKNPMLLNLRYRIRGADTTNMFPKALPDFFKNTEFTLFGRYSNEDKFLLQLLGESPSGETNEFIVAGSFKDAQKGDRDIARDWAFNKIYYLISLLEYGKDSKEITKEINLLCGKFGIETPYSGAIWVKARKE